jgi:hypothetical protein
MDVLRTAVFHEKALFVKTNVVAITLERIICPAATLPFALSIRVHILWDSVHDGVPSFRADAAISKPVSLRQRDQDSSRSRRYRTLAEQQQL